MAVGLWERLYEKTLKDIKVIFAKYDLDKLSDMEKRRIVFNYLYEHISYDHDLFNKITASKLGLTERARRNTPQELYDTMFKNKGICNGIAEYYKLILEELGIPAYYVVCTYQEKLINHQKELAMFKANYQDFDDEVSIGHALNVIYDRDTKTYSIDDLTFAIIKQNKDDYFAYDMAKAHSYKQGLSCVLKNYKWLIISEAYIDMITGRRDHNSNLHHEMNLRKHEANLFLKENKIEYDVNLDDDTLVKDKVI